jgi:hypothetical protein
MIVWRGTAHKRPDVGNAGARLFPAVFDAVDSGSDQDVEAHAKRAFQFTCCCDYPKDLRHKSYTTGALVFVSQAGSKREN